MATLLSNHVDANKSVPMRNKKGVARTDTTVSNGSTVSCSTCDTASTVSHDPGGSVDGDCSTCRSSFQSTSSKTISQPSSARTSTFTEDTVADDKSSVYSPIRVDKAPYANFQNGDIYSKNNLNNSIHSQSNGAPFWDKPNRYSGIIGDAQKPSSKLLQNTGKGKSQDSLLTFEFVRDQTHSTTSQLNSSWKAPNLNSFSRSTTFDASDNKPVLLETSM